MDALKATGLCRGYGKGDLKTKVLDGFDLTLASGVSIIFKAKVFYYIYTSNIFFGSSFFFTYADSTDYSFHVIILQFQSSYGTLIPAD